MWQMDISAPGVARVKIVNVVAENIARARELVSKLTMNFGDPTVNALYSYVQTMSPKHIMRLSNSLEKEQVLDLLIY